MSLKTDLESEVGSIFTSSWTERDGQVVPESSDLKLGNDAVKLKGAVLYADLSSSTALVDNKSKEFAAEIYKSYLHCCAKIIRNEGGAITSYDGDRIMAVFIGDYKNTSAVRAALRINWARQEIIQPKLKKVYTTSEYVVKHTVGIDSSDLFVARTGVRGANDLVWVGKAANHAAKLNDLSAETPLWITDRVYDAMMDAVKYDTGKPTGTNMWTKKSWTPIGGATVYCSTYRQSFA